MASAMAPSAIGSRPSTDGRTIASRPSGSTTSRSIIWRIAGFR